MRKYYKIKSTENCKEVWEKVKGEYDGLSLSAQAVFTKGAEDNRFKVTFSTDTEDRHWDRVYQNFDLKNFKNNPVLLDSHNYDTIANIVGRVENPKIKDNRLQGDVVFALENPKGLLAYHLAKGGFLNATSIGFIPLEFDDKGNITKSELLEISVVSVPANPEALFEKMVKEAIKDVEGQEQEDIKNEEDEENEAETEDVAKNKDEIENDDLSPTLPEGAEVVEITEISEVDAVGDKVYREIKEMRDNQKRLLIALAQGLKKANPHEQKRQLYKTIREIFKQDMGIGR